MMIVGLTGGIGSGKSMVAHLFSEFGVPIIDADQVARELVLPFSPTLKEIELHFGKAILRDDASLNRPKLREIIFEHPEEREWLENLLHPKIRSTIKNRIKKLSNPYCILVVPLLVEAQSYDYVNRILVVDTTEALQIERTQKRDGLSVDFIKKIMETQATRKERIAAADDIISNNGTMSELKEQVKKHHQKYLLMK
ncbi:MAG: dephospho-CoA kinase [Proteobacteria bacterium]|nr:dephospho-CoA kinase [Pseudomonadota bacterium]